MIDQVSEGFGPWKSEETPAVMSCSPEGLTSKVTNPSLTQTGVSGTGNGMRRSAVHVPASRLEASVFLI